jgi:hypothetical protein
MPSLTKPLNPHFGMCADAGGVGAGGQVSDASGGAGTQQGQGGAEVRTRLMTHTCINIHHVHFG